MRKPDTQKKILFATFPKIRTFQF